MHAPPQPAAVSFRVTQGFTSEHRRLLKQEGPCLSRLQCVRLSQRLWLCLAVAQAVWSVRMVQAIWEAVSDMRSCR